MMSDKTYPVTGVTYENGVRAVSSERPVGWPIRRRSGLLVVSLAAVVAGALLCGCGSGGSPSAALRRSPASVPALPSAAAGVGSAAPDLPSAQPSPGGGSASIGQVCQAMTLSLSVLTEVTASPNNPSVTEGIAQLRGLHDTAPVEIRNDLQVIADFDDEMVAAVRSGRSPAGIGETPRLTQALSDEAHWTATHCAH